MSLNGRQSNDKDKGGSLRIFQFVLSSMDGERRNSFEGVTFNGVLKHRKKKRNMSYWKIILGI